MDHRKRIKVILCANINQKVNKSWGKTGSFFLEELQKHADVIGIIDYSIKNRFLKKIHKLYNRIIIGQESFQNPFGNYRRERNFIRKFKKLNVVPDVFIHLSSMVVPHGLSTKAMHVQYTDATISGSIKYNNTKYTNSYIKNFNKFTARYMGRMHCIFTFNEWTKNSLIEDFNVDVQKVINIGFGANLDYYKGEKRYDNKLILIVLRRGLEKNKGLHLLLEAFKRARKIDNDIRLAVVGTTLEPIEGVAYYEGFSREKTIELFREAVLYAMPALFEPNGMVYIEALASKTPIMGLDRLAFPEFAGYGNYGFIVPENPDEMATTLVEALNNPEKLQQMGSAGQNFVAGKYKWEVVVNNILQNI